MENKLTHLFFFVLFILLAFNYCQSAKTNNELKKYGPIKLFFVGDIMFNWAVEETIEKFGLYYPVENIKAHLMQYDYVFGNLETPVTNNNNPDPSKKYVFKSKPKYIKLLKYANINNVSIANNHITDYGLKGFKDTIINLYNNHINIGGGGFNSNSSLLPFIIKNNKGYVVIFFYTVLYDKRYLHNKLVNINIFDLKKAIEQIKIYNTDEHIKIIYIHWGNEYIPYPTYRQKKKTKKLIDAGADIIIGHHPHICQGIEKYKDGYIFYSLGNFLFGSINEYLNHNIGIEFQIDNNKIKKIKVFGIKGKFNKYVRLNLLNNYEAKEFFDYLLKISKPLNKKNNLKATIDSNYMLIE